MMCALLINELMMDFTLEPVSHDDKEMVEDILEAFIHTLNQSVQQPIPVWITPSTPTDIQQDLPSEVKNKVKGEVKNKVQTETKPLVDFTYTTRCGKRGIGHPAA